MDLLNINSSCK